MLDSRPADVPTPRARRDQALLVLEAMRPKQWTKNAFVLAGIVFAGEVGNPDALLRTFAVFVAFCLASGSTYLLNDAVDVEKDRLNPRTRNRPMARGDLSLPVAYGAAAASSLVALALAGLCGWKPAAVVGAYQLLQIAYSLKLKHVLFIDVMVIASGFTLRAYGGIVAIDVETSPWLLLCTSLLAMLLALTKRRGEAVALNGEQSPHRPVLDFYSVALLDELISVITPTTLVSYALYTVQGASSDAMLLTLPFVLYGIFRLLFIIHHRSGVTEEPDQLVWKDRPLMLCVLSWGCAAAIVTLTA